MAADRAQLLLAWQLGQVVLVLGLNHRGYVGRAVLVPQYLHHE